MREKILRLLEGSKKSYLINEIYETFGLKTKLELKQLRKEIELLENEGFIYRTRKDKYVALENCHLKVGKLVVHKKGFGFVLLVNEPDLRIAPMHMKGAIHNDIVAVTKHYNNTGKIVKIIKREIEPLIGEYYKEGRTGFVKLDDLRYKIKVQINDDEAKKVIPGHKVLVQVQTKIKHNVYRGSIKEVLGHKNDPGIDILCIAYQHGFKAEFPSLVWEEAMKTPSIVTKDDFKGRRDLRKECIFTIDGADAKDLDDAISIVKLRNGNYKLGIHIADVSYYVKENSNLALEAETRGTSVYLVDRVMPMLPQQLANGICSLTEKVDRLTITCEMEINETGSVVNHELFESVICSKKRMTYQAVNTILETGKKVKGYEQFEDKLKLMQELALILRRNKIKRGYLDFDLAEIKILVDEQGKPYKIERREAGMGEQLIEDFMIVANETVATCIYKLKLPFIYRVHEHPEVTKVKGFLELISLMGYKVKANPKKFTAVVVQQILDLFKTKPAALVLSSLLLRSMQKAVYQPDNIGHFGLGSNCYTHFTAPIRRYPDLIVHRLLREYLFKPKINSKEIEKWSKKLASLCLHCSSKERMAIECEREVISLKACEYMEGHLGEKYEGMIVGMINIGFFVQLDNLIEGLVHLKDLDDDYYHFDERAMRFYGKRRGRQFRLGDRVQVEVLKASKQERTLDFKIIKK